MFENWTQVGAPADVEELVPQISPLIPNAPEYEIVAEAVPAEVAASEIVIVVGLSTLRTTVPAAKALPVMYIFGYTSLVLLSVTVVELRTVVAVLVYPPTISGSLVGTPALLIANVERAVPY